MTQRSLAQQVEATLAILGSATHYELLGVPENADVDTIRAAFHEKARIFHVDSHGGDLGALREPMQRIFGELSKANTVLTDAQAREAYNTELDLARRGIPTDVRTIFEADQAFRAGKRLTDRGNFAAALESLNQAVGLNAAEPDYWAYLWWSEYGTLEVDNTGMPRERRRASELVASMKKLIQEHESSVPAHVFLGHMLRLRGETEEARRSYRNATRLDPDNTEAASNLRLLAMRKDNQEKEGFFQRLFKRKK